MQNNDKKSLICKEIWINIEISRILLRENLDIKDYLKDKNISLDMNLVDLNDLFSCFSEQASDESDDSESEDENNEV